MPAETPHQPNNQTDSAAGSFSATEATGALNSHRIVDFLGKDAAAFLQGYLTCDTNDIDLHSAKPGAFTNLKGRVVANGWVWGEPAAVHMLVAESLTETISDFLKPYLNFSRTKLSVREAAPTVRINQTQAPEDVLSENTSHEDVAIDSFRTVTESRRRGLTGDVSLLWLQSCIAQSEVVVTADTQGTFLPQMLGLTELGAVSFEKGCYLGQEVVARAQHRGEVKRRIRRASYVANTQLKPGDQLSDLNGKRQGQVINATATDTLFVSAAELQASQTWSVDSPAGAFEVELSFSETASE